MGESSHKAETTGTENQNNAMSDDPRDGSRNAFKPGAVGKTPVEKAPPGDEQNQATIEDMGREGLGIAPKE